MTIWPEKYLTDAQGNRIGVVLDMAQFQRILDDLEELDDIRAYDAAKAEGGETVPFEQAMAEIDAERRR